MTRRGDPGRLLEQSTGGVAGEPHLASTKRLYYEGAYDGIASVFAS